MNVEDTAIALTERLARLLETEFEALSDATLSASKACGAEEGS